jgi:hypothetical protein
MQNLETTVFFAKESISNSGDPVRTTQKKKRKRRRTPVF